MLHHDALLYSGNEEYITAIRDFTRGGVEGGGAVLIAVPQPKLAVLRASLGDLGGRVQFADMRQIGINPARIIPFVKAFIDEHRQRPVRFVGEPIWVGRSEAETVEAVRHEGLLNAVFARAGAQILCPYDTGELSADVLDDARRTHPTVLEGGRRCRCGDYVDPLETYAADGRPLPEPTVDPLKVSVDGELVSFRSVVKEHAQSAGMGPDRVASFLIAANEAAANTLVHAGGNGSARLWHDEHEVVCEVSDAGVIEDPLVGRRTPPADRSGGRGVWLMNQLSDLVELRSGARGTVVRIHMRRDAA